MQPKKQSSLCYSSPVAAAAAVTAARADQNIRSMSIRTETKEEAVHVMDTHPAEAHTYACGGGDPRVGAVFKGQGIRAHI